MKPAIENLKKLYSPNPDKRLVDYVYIDTSGEAISARFQAVNKGQVEEQGVLVGYFKDYVDDHFAHFEAYPVDIEIDDVIYDWGEYWSIMESHYRGSTEDVL